MSEGARFSRWLGFACAIAASGTLLGWVMLQLGSKPIPLIAYDQIVGLTQVRLLLPLLLSVALLGTCCALILKRSRYAPWLFLLGGWGGLINTALMVIPGRRIMNLATFGLNAAKNKGVLPKDAGLVDLIRLQLPGSLLATLLVLSALALLIWLTLLIAGTVHMLKRRSLYNG